MKRWLSGSVVLATSVGLWACSGDPTNSFRNGASGLVATPTSVFLTEGETKEVLVSATDDQGNPLPITLEASNVGPGITVVRDENYLPTTAGGQIQGTT